MTQWNKYAPTAARTHGRPGRETRPKSITIDIHAHVGVPAAAEIVRPHLDLATVPLAHYADPATKALNLAQEADIVARRPLATRIADLDAMGLDMQAVLPPPPQCYYTVPLDIAVKATRVLNDGIAEYCGQRPDRFVGLGSVPMADAGEAVLTHEMELAQQRMERRISEDPGALLGDEATLGDVEFLLRLEVVPFKGEAQILEAAEKTLPAIPDGFPCVRLRK